MTGKGHRQPARWSTLALLLLAGVVALLLVRWLARPRPAMLPAAAMGGEPLTMLWAWETPEDLTGLDPARAGVAYLDREIMLGHTLGVALRRQPLRAAPGTWVMAVVRLDAPYSIDDDPAFRQELVAAVLPATQQPNVRALQIDFDATASQVAFYAAFIKELRSQMPAGMPLSITALVSWCGPQSWLPQVGRSVDEAVPMYFRMGGTARLRHSTPKDNGLVTQPLCAGSVGVATDEPWPNTRATERVYIFRTGSWSTDDVRRVNAAGASALKPR